MIAAFIYRIADHKIDEVWRVADDLSSFQQVGTQIIMPGTNVDAPGQLCAGGTREDRGIAKQK